MAQTGHHSQTEKTIENTSIKFIKRQNRTLDETSVKKANRSRL